MKNLTIISVGLRTERWSELVASIASGIKKYSYEIILVGPQGLPKNLYKNSNVRYIKEVCHPTRKYMAATAIADGEFIGYINDDALVEAGSIDRSLDLLINNRPETDVVALRHIQTHNYDGVTPSFSQRNEEWWNITTQRSLRTAYTSDDWKVVCDPLIKRSRLEELGGLDCRFSFLNYSIHDLSFRLQGDGGKVLLSKDIVQSTPIHAQDHHTAIHRYVERDTALYYDIWSKPRPIAIDINHWKTTPSVWEHYKNIFQLV